MAYSAKIIADSISEFGDRLTTMEITFPRMVLAEFNTHRMFSRNSASSRAIPVEKQLERIMNDPFIPSYWGKNQSGMQANEELDEESQLRARDAWIMARDEAFIQAKKMMSLGVHKQITNRILEPFMWHTVIVTATEWSNFFALRAHEDAQPEIRTIAETMKALYAVSEPVKREVGDWHLPYIQDEERDGIWEHSILACKVSAARCARVSYLTHDGVRDLKADLALYERLVSGGHMSPLEHVAVPQEPGITSGSNFRGWLQFRKTIINEHDFSLVRTENIH
jgi:hypothetical protein